MLLKLWVVVGSLFSGRFSFWIQVKNKNKRTFWAAIFGEKWFRSPAWPIAPTHLTPHLLHNTPRFKTHPQVYKHGKRRYTNQSAHLAVVIDCCVMQRWFVTIPQNIHVGPCLQQLLGNIHIANVTSLMKRCPAWKNGEVQSQLWCNGLSYFSGPRAGDTCCPLAAAKHSTCANFKAV